MNFAEFIKSQDVTGEKKLDFFQGEGYGPSNLKDISGKPLLTFENKHLQESQLLPERTDVEFDFTKPQKLAPEMLKNGRMPEGVSQEVKKLMGGNHSEELDHAIALELSGSNRPENLRLEQFVPGTRETATDPLENQIAHKVISGEMSLLEGQKELAKAKGLSLPEESGHPLLNLSTQHLGFFGTMLQGLEAVVQDIGKTLQEKSGRVGKAPDFPRESLEHLLERSAPVQFFSRAEVEGAGKAFKDVYLHSGGSFTADDMNSVLQKHQDFMKQGMSPKDAMAKAAGEVRGQKMLDFAIGFVGGADLEAENLFKEGVQEAEGAISKESATAFQKGMDASTKTAVDDAAQNEAMMNTVSRNMGRGGIKGFVPELRSEFENWVNQRSSGRIKSFFKRQEFKDLDASGMEGILNFQETEPKDLTGRFAILKDYFNRKYKELADAGVNMGYRGNYLPQLWKESPQQVNQVLGARRLSLSAPFTMETVFEDYAEGIQAGFTPKFTKISELAGWYEQRANKLLADKSFFDFLASHNYIQPSGRVFGWKTIPSEVFPYRIVDATGKEFFGQHSAPPALADAITNYLKPGVEPLSTFSRFTGLLKNILLTSGIPGTGLNIHGFNVAVRSIMAAENPFVAATKTFYWLVRPNAAQKFVIDNAERAAFFAEHGLMTSSEDHFFEDAVSSLPEEVLTKERNILARWFSDPLFKKSVTALKVDKAESLYRYFLGRGFDEERAAKMASEQANNLFGGLNLDMMGRDKNWQNFWRSVVFAPDFQESGARLGAGIVKSILNPRNPEYHMYRTLARNIALTYISANIVNKLTAGRFMWENDPGHTMDIAIGKSSDGKFRYLRPFGSAVDFVRIPYDMAFSLVRGDFDSAVRLIRNRVSVPLGIATTVLTGVDTFGRKIFDPTTTGTDRAIELARQAAGAVAPQAVSQAIDYFSGRSNLEEAVSYSLGLPLRFAKTTKAQADMNKLIFDERSKLSTRVKKLFAEGKNDEAMQVIMDYNRSLYDAAVRAFKTRGETVPEKNVIIRRLKRYWMRPPKHKAIQQYEKSIGKSFFEKTFDE